MCLLHLLGLGHPSPLRIQLESRREEVEGKKAGTLGHIFVLPRAKFLSKTGIGFPKFNCRESSIIITAASPPHLQKGTELLPAGWAGTWVGSASSRSGAHGSWIEPDSNHESEGQRGRQVRKASTDAHRERGQGHGTEWYPPHRLLLVMTTELAVHGLHAGLHAHKQAAELNQDTNVYACPPTPS